MKFSGMCNVIVKYFLLGNAAKEMLNALLLEKREKL